MNRTLIIKLILIFVAINGVLLLDLQLIVYFLWCLGEEIGHSFTRNFVVISLNWIAGAILFDRWNIHSKISDWLNK